MSLSFNPSAGLIIVPTRLWGPAGDTIASLALDTGATTTTVSWTTLQLLGYDPGAVPHRQQVTTGSGIEYVPRLPVERVEALAQQRLHFPVLCHTLPPSTMVDGVLGLDFLQGQELIIDFRTGTVQLR